MMPRSIALVLWLLGQAFAARAADWQIGLAQREITPQRPVHLAGYAARNKPFEKVADPLFLKALALEDAAGRVGVLIASDLIGFHSGVGDQIAQRIQESAGLQRRQILLNSSHTHCGPTLFLAAADPPPAMTKEDIAETIAYTRRLIDLAVEAALEALHSRRPGRLSYGIGVCRFAMNRREWTPSGIKLGVNPSGYVDRSAPVLRIDDEQGQLRGVLFGAAVHNTTLGGTDYVVSGDYAGAAQRFIVDRHPQAQALFLLGCAGSANPHPRGTLDDVQRHGSELGTEVCRVLETKLAPVRGPLTMLLEDVALPLQEPPSRESIAELLTSKTSWLPYMARKMTKQLEAGQELPRSITCPVAFWQFGEDLSFVGLSGEVVNEYVPLIENAISPGRLWVSAYCNNVFGYVPTAQILKDGGYETRGVIYGAVGLFAPETEAVLVGKVQDLARQAGRPGMDQAAKP
jgi:hypothetical protein